MGWGSVFRVCTGWFSHDSSWKHLLVSPPLSTFSQTWANEWDGSSWKCVHRRWQLLKKYTNSIDVDKRWMWARSSMVLCLLAVFAIGVCTWHVAIMLWYRELCQLSWWDEYLSFGVHCEWARDEALYQSLPWHTRFIIMIEGRTCQPSHYFVLEISTLLVGCWGKLEQDVMLLQAHYVECMVFFKKTI